MSGSILSLNGVSKAFGFRQLLDGVNLGVDAGEKVGIIGANGAGKSTLLKIIAGSEQADAGNATLRSGTRIAFGEQLPDLTAYGTVGDVLEHGVRDIKQAIAAYEEATNAAADDTAALLERIEQLGGWDYQHRVQQAAMEVGLSDLAAPVLNLSGGERKRAALASLLLQQPDLLLLDEPTNHLDAETVEWLEKRLTSSATTVMLVTHDRYFLNDVANRLVELRDGGLKSYAGNYTDYLATRALEEVHRERRHHRQLQTLMSELEWARRSPKARTTKSRSRLDRIEATQKEVKNLASSAFAADFSFGKAPRLGSTILELKHVHMSYADGPPLIADLTLTLRAGERIGILGSNGSGKTTLLKLITGELSATRGSIKVGLNTRIAYFDQQRSALDPELTLRRTLTPQGGDVVHPGGGAPVHVASWLDQFGFPTPTHDRPVHTLSGGEQNRLSIALFLLQEANLLIFDEPTNDLDIPALHMLEDAIVNFAGCVLVVTHDRYLLDKVCTSILAFEREHAGEGVVTRMEGGYTHYHAQRLTQLKQATAVAAKKRLAAEREQKQATDARSKKPRKGVLTYAERLELEGIEPKIEAADAAVKALQEQLSDPDLWKDADKAHAVQSELATATRHSAELYARWEYLLER